MTLFRRDVAPVFFPRCSIPAVHGGPYWLFPIPNTDLKHLAEFPLVR